MTREAVMEFNLRQAIELSHDYWGRLCRQVLMHIPYRYIVLFNSWYTWVTGDEMVRWIAERLLDLEHFIIKAMGPAPASHFVDVATLKRPRREELEYLKRAHHVLGVLANIPLDAVRYPDRTPVDTVPTNAIIQARTLRADLHKYMVSLGVESISRGVS